MCIFKQYSDILGKVGEGAHKHKLFKVILVDNLLTLALAVFVSYYWSFPFPLAIIGVYIVSIIFHYLFGVQTQSLKYLGIRC
jgi:uncharacterized membrane protein